MFKSCPPLLVFSIIFMCTSSYAEDTYEFYTRSLQPLRQIEQSSKSMSEDLIGDIGQGWSSDNESPVAKCLVGTVNHVGTPSGSLALDRQYSYQEILNQMNLNVDGKVSFLGFSLNAGVKYAKMLRDTSLSESFIYRASILLKNRQFVTPENRNPLTWIGQQYASDGIKFRKFCGDKFIAQQKIGGSLYVALKFNFRNLEVKKEFEQYAKASFTTFLSIEEKLSKLSQNIKNDGSVSLVAFQIGGNPAKLGQILGSTSGTTAPILTCGLNNVSACQAAMNKILLYASQSADGNFPTQFNDSDPRSTTGPGIMENAVQEYGVVIPIEKAPSKVTPEIIAARIKLSTLYENAVGVDNILEAFQQGVWPMSNNYLRIVNEYKIISEQNLAKIREAGKICYTDTFSDCISIATSIDKQLQPIDLKKVATIYYGQTSGAGEFYLFPYNDNVVRICFAKICSDEKTYPRLQFAQVFNENQIYIPRDKTKEYLFVSATSTDKGKTYRGTAHVWVQEGLSVTIQALEINEAHTL